jgi:hypothetical protein
MSCCVAAFRETLVYLGLHWLIYLHIDPSMDDLREDPRFEDLLKRVGLPAPSDLSSS